MIYLDNAATTKTAPEVVEAMLPYFTEKFGNPMQEKRWHGFFMPKMRVRLCLPQILQRR